MFGNSGNPASAKTHDRAEADRVRATTGQYIPAYNSLPETGLRMWAVEQAVALRLSNPDLVLGKAEELATYVRAAMAGVEGKS